MPKVTHFEITATDVAATAEFYGRVFGWKTGPSEFIPGYVLLGLGTSEGGAVMERKYHNQPTIVWFEVDDLDATIEKVVAAGGRAVNAKQSLPGVGDLVYVADPEGTVIGLKQPA